MEAPEAFHWCLNRPRRGRYLLKRGSNSRSLAPDTWLEAPNAKLEAPNAKLEASDAKLEAPDAKLEAPEA